MVAFLLKILCHPGTCSLVLSGTIKYKGLVLDILLNPLVHLGWILSYGGWNFLAAPPPVSIGTHVYDHRIRAAQQIFNLMSGNPGYLPGVASQQNNCLVKNKKKYEARPSAPSHKPSWF
jgi:hypothetical protein